MSDEFLIWSHHHQMWFAPNGSGYRSDVTRAGRFEADAVPQWLGRGCECCQVPEVAVPAPPAADLALVARVTASINEQRKAATDARIEAGSINKYAARAQAGAA